MSTQDDVLFGQIALSRGYITRDLLTKALQYQQRLPVHQPLGEILLEKNVMSRMQVQDVIAQQRSRLTSGPSPAPVNPTISPVSSSGPMPALNFNQTRPSPYAPPTSPYGRPQSGRNPILVESARGPAAMKPVGQTATAVGEEGEPVIIGRIFGGCVAVQKIGEGGMGAIYLARHDKLDKKVVVKVLPPKAAKKKKNLERFRREAKSAARLEHPNIVQVLNVDETEDGLHYIIMQYIDGRNLNELIQERGPQDWRESTRIVRDSAMGLRAAHASDIIHRDIKAENIMITKSGVVKVADFGLAKDLSSNLKLTADGAFIGTPLYMAPEIGRVAQIDGRVDIFSLGMTYYYLLTGVQPFRGFKTMEILSARAHDKIKPPEKYVELPNEVRRVLGKMLAKDRDDRYLNVDDLISDLDALQQGRSVKAGPPKLWGEDGAEPEDHELEASVESEPGASQKALLGLIIGGGVLAAILIFIIVLSFF